jgi:DNA polymerase elongation subunit (family B)
MTLPRNGELLELAATYLTNQALANHLGVPRETLRDHIRRECMVEAVAAAREPKHILVFDIETMANLAWVWGYWQQNINPKAVVKHKRTISFAAKWVGDSKVIFRSEFHDGREAMVQTIWDLLEKADAVVGYNSKRFDIKHLNTEFKLDRIGPPTHFQHIDLYQVTKREFAFGSAKLDSVAERLELGKKREHEGFPLWIKCEAGDPEAWNRMKSYNIQDVRLTEKLFDELRDWIPLRGVNSSRVVRELLDDLASE